MRASRFVVAAAIVGAAAGLSTSTAAASPAPVPTAPIVVQHELVMRDIAEPTGAITDDGLRAAFEQGMPIVEAVQYFPQYNTTVGVIYRVVHDAVALTSPTAKFVVAMGQPPADEFVATISPISKFGAMTNLVGHYETATPYPGHFFNTPPVQVPGAFSAAGIAIITP